MATVRQLRPQADDAGLFLQAVFGGKAPEHRVVFWTLADKRSIPFTDLDQAVEWVGVDRPDTYLHVGLVESDPQPHQRPSASDIRALVGLWADLDIADPVHKKRGLPAGEPEALEIARATGLEPSVIVRSGHGLQCWWLFGELLETVSELERRDAAILARAWDISLRGRASHQGCTLDAVGDLARLLRLPGTVNAKASPVPVTLYTLAPERRISRDDAERALLDGAWQQAEREISGRRSVSWSAPSDGDLVLNAQAEPPWDKLEALRDADADFDRSWRRKRKDLASPSEYDLSLARYAAMAGWSRQEIANLIIANRRKHGDDLKLRQDYFAATIDKATADRDEWEEVADALAAVEESKHCAPGDIDRAALLARISAALRIEIVRLTRSRSEPPVFSIETPHGSGMLGGISAVIENNRFRAKVGELTGILPRRLKNDRWDPLAEGLLKVAELQEEVAETTIRGRVESWVSLYLGSHLPRRIADLDDKARGMLAHSLDSFVGDDGKTRIFSTGFRRWLLADQHEQKMPPQELAEMLRVYGAKNETANFRTATGRTTRTLWVLPSDAENGYE